MEASGQAGGQDSGPEVGEDDYVAEAASAVADALREAHLLSEIAASHNPHLAASYGQRLREALVVVLIALGKARSARRRASG